MRFNRQRREVCYFPSGSDEPIIQPWEELVVWVSVSTGTTGTTGTTGDGIMSNYTLGMAVEVTPGGLSVEARMLRDASQVATPQVDPQVTP